MWHTFMRWPLWCMLLLRKSTLFLLRPFAFPQVKILASECIAIVDQMQLDAHLAQILQKLQMRKTWYVTIYDVESGKTGKGVKN